MVGAIGWRKDPEGTGTGKDTQTGPAPAGDRIICFLQLGPSAESEVELGSLS